MKIKTIDINALEWFDRINGNSYFAGEITVNFGMKNEKRYGLPFQYGYGDHYIQIACKILKAKKIINIQDNQTLWRYCKENNIILRTYKHGNCRKKELINY